MPAYGLASTSPYPQQSQPQQYKPYMRLVPNSELTQLEQARLQQANVQSSPVITSLAGHIQSCWQEAQQTKDTIQERLLNCLRQRSGIYDPDKLAKIQTQGGSEIFMGLTSVKCRALESWIRDILRPPGDKPWALQSTPVPELPPATEAFIQREVVMQYMQIQAASTAVPDINQVRKLKEKAVDRLKAKIKDEADKAAELMEDRINDEFLEGHWYDALDDIISDIATFPTAFMAGPIIRKKKVLDWSKNPEGQWKPIITEKLVKEYERISPFDVYPSPSAKNLNEGYLIVREILPASELSKCIGLPGYDSESIKTLLKDNPTGLRTWLNQDAERSRLEGRDREEFSGSNDGKFESLKFYGSVQGRLLREWGMDEQEVPDESATYEIVAKMIGSYVIRAVLNPDPLGHRQIYSASFEQIPDSIWGKAPPELMADVQAVCNACARALVNNMAIASGPQVWIDKDRVADKDIESLYPWRIWQFVRDETGSGAAPMAFFQPNPMVEALLKVYDYYFKQAGEVTGIPNYVYGMAEASGAAKTASGLSMLMNSAGKGIKQCIFHLDDGIIVPSIQSHYNLLMLYDEDESIKGDVDVVPKGSTALVLEEQRQLRLNEFLQVAANPVYAQIFGRKGLANLLREAIKGLHMPMDTLIPSDDEIEAQEDMAKTVEIVQKLSVALQIPPQVLLQFLSVGQGGPPLQGQAAGQPGQPGQPQQPGQQGQPGMPMPAPVQMSAHTNLAGQRMSGADTRVMQRPAIRRPGMIPTQRMVNAQ